MFLGHIWYVILLCIIFIDVDSFQDEIFHIPQAQAYCLERYDVWDQKLTTPPGL